MSPHLRKSAAAPPEVALRVAITAEFAQVAELSTDLSQCVESGHRAVELALGQDEELVAGTYAVLAYALYLQGKDEEAYAAAQAALERPEAPRRPHAVIFALACRSLVELDRGHLHSAETDARQAMGAARRLGLSAVTAAGHARLAMGKVHLALGEASAAERNLERAEALRRASRPTLQHAHVLLRLAEARLACGRIQVAYAELEMANDELDSFADAGRLTGLAAGVRQSLTEALSTAAKPVETPTAAELQVLRLLPSDLTLRQIGDELYLSHNTVKTHSRNLYRKLGAGNRVDAVRRAVEVGLLTSRGTPKSLITAAGSPSSV